MRMSGIAGPDYYLSESCLSDAKYLTFLYIIKAIIYGELSVLRAISKSGH